MKSPLRPAVVMVADRTLSADYKVLFEGIFATMQTTSVPELVMRRLLSPPAAADRQGRARTAPLGLRRAESSLLAKTPLTARDVVCTTPEALGGLLGPWVKIVAVSSSDPLGAGMSNTTTANFWPGELYTRAWTRRLMGEIAAAKSPFGFKVVAGGAGAWQYRADRRAAAEQGIDAVFDGYFEAGGCELFMDLLAGREAPREIAPAAGAADAIAPIAGASTLGVIELSRGCGRGCGFCAMARLPMAHLPAGIILADLQTNIAAGVRSVVSASEDFFRYGGKGVKVNFPALASLLEEMKRLPGLGFMQIDHANISSVLQYTDDQLKQIRSLLSRPGRTECLWVNMGAESASGRLVEAVAAGKIAPFGCDDWQEMVRQSADKMIRCGFLPVFSVILGLPGETGRDVESTQAMVEHLGAAGAVIFPIFYEPVRPAEGPAGARFTLADMRAEHLKLYTTCYEINFKRVPRLFRDNQRAGGVSWFKRALLGALGRVEIRSWRRNFRRAGRRIARSSAEGN